MQHENIPIGPDAPISVNAIIEVPKGSSNKYKYNPAANVYRYDHTLFHRSFIPATMAGFAARRRGERKPLNIMVMSTNATFVGCLIVSRPIGALLMHDHKGEDHKVLSVAVADPRFDGIRSLNDLSNHTLLEIQHFFEIYQVLEQREVSIGGWEDVAQTQARIKAAAGLV